MTLPPAPRELKEAVRAPPPTPDRRCSSCRTPLVSQGTHPFRTGGAGRVEGFVPLEMAWCPACGRVELFSAA